MAVAEHLSFRDAADACFVAQPGLSAQLKDLEEGLGVQLFERSQRKVLLTIQGETLLPRARGLLTASDEFVDLARSLTQPLSGILRLGVIPTVAPCVEDKKGFPCCKSESIQSLLHHAARRLSIRICASCCFAISGTAYYSASSASDRRT